MSDLVGNPEEGFSCDVAHISRVFLASVTEQAELSYKTGLLMTRHQRYQIYLSYTSMAQIHLHRPSQAVEATRTLSGSKSGFLMYLSRICFMYATGILSCKQNTCHKELCHMKPCLQVVRPGPTQTRLHNHRRWLDYYKKVALYLFSLHEAEN